MKRHKLFLFSLVITLLLILFGGSPVNAQTDDAPVYRLNINRDFGYGGGADIRGLFSLRVVGPEGIRSVTYLIDGVEMTTITEEPFKFQFNTSQYEFGWHDITADVINTSGEVFTTPARHLNFVNAAAEAEGMKRIVLPMLGLVVGIVVIIGVVQYFVMLKRHPAGIPPGTQRNYGFAGGSICRYCSRPTPRHIWGINIGIGKLDRCDNCGRWSVMQAVPLELLRTAEEAEKVSETSKPSISEKSDEDKLRDLIDKSKYD